MKIQICNAIIFLTLSIFINGCSDEPPKCSDEKTYSIVRKIIMEQVDQQTLDRLHQIGLTDEITTEHLKFEFARASDYDEKIKKYTCEATLISGDFYQLPISYSSQLDDSGEQIVSLRSISQRDLPGVLGGLIKSIPSNSTKANDEKPTQSSASLENIPTRYGKLQINKEKTPNEILYNGKTITSVDEEYLSIEKTFQLQDKDLYLIQSSSGGTACPAKYYFVTITQNGFNLTPSFGTCTDKINTKKIDNTILVTMSGFVGPFESEADQQKASSITVSYKYIDGKIIEE